ncbi:DUF5050 domain-containing protein [Brevibacillus sp. H7]|uniref:DUF5050 domain-containing protein n=1 Tax=Brevibacillus sp. H7 TaxID=3349138 RepID=UPI0037F5BC42
MKNIKKYANILSLIVIVVFLCQAPKPLYADSSLDLRLHEEIVLFIDSPKAYVNNQVVQIDPENKNIVPLVKNNRTLVPVRFISENMGGDVSWNPVRESVTIIHEDKHIQLTIGEPFMGMNGLAEELDTPPEIISGRVYLPLRAIAEALGQQVFWDHGLIMISKQKFEKEGNENVINRLAALLKVEKPAVEKPLVEKPRPAADTYPVMLETYGPGTALLQGGYVYYNDGFYLGNGLYRFPYGNEKSKKILTKDATSSMNIQGDWIYYVVPNASGSFGKKNPIKKIKKTGSAPVTITTDDQITEMVVNGDWIYYLSSNYNQKKVTLNRIKTNGTSKKVLLESYESFSNVSDSKKGDIRDIHVHNGYIYFLRLIPCGYGKDCSQIYRMKTDGSGMVILNKSEYAVRMQVAHGKIYYSRFPEELRHDNAVPIDLYSMDLNGKNPAKISKNLPGNYIYFLEEFRVHGDWIYFAFGNHVSKMRTDGSSFTTLAEVVHPYRFHVVGEWLYFRSITNAHRVKTDGKGYEMLHW